MKELFDKFDRLSSKKADYLVDTCFLYFIFEKGHTKEFVKFCDEHLVVLTSFTADEFLYHSHDLDENIRVRFRSAVKRGLRLFYHSVPVSPGSSEAEKEFVSSVDLNLLKLIPDPSDAVLAAVAVNLRASILTRDKRHLFTSELINYFENISVKVLNNLPR